MKRVRTLVRSLVRRTGYDIVWFDPRGSTLKAHLGVILPALAVDCVVDVGAHHGEFGSMVREVGYRGPIVSFEPIGASFERLRDIAGRDGAWTVHRLALGDADGAAVMHVTSLTNMASLHAPTPPDSAKLRAAAEVVAHEQVDVRRLDHIAADVLPAEAERLMLKLDTQGHNRAVLRGAGETLRRVVVVQVELAVVPLYEDVERYHELLAELEGLGFALTGIFPLVWDGRRVVELDAVLVRDR